MFLSMVQFQAGFVAVGIFHVKILIVEFQILLTFGNVWTLDTSKDQIVIFIFLRGSLSTIDINIIFISSIGMI